MGIFTGDVERVTRYIRVRGGVRDMDKTLLTESDIQRIAAYCEAATPGQGLVVAEDTCATCRERGQSEWDVHGLPRGHHALFNNQADAVFDMDARLDLPRAIATLKVAWKELDAFAHSDRLIQASLQQFITDCSTPTFQLVRNAVDELEAYEITTKRLTARIAELQEERDALTEYVKRLEAECSSLKSKLTGRSMELISPGQSIVQNNQDS